MAKRGQRDAGKERYWRRLLRLWRCSGLTGREFCAEQGLSEPSFYAWRREIARRDEEVTEVEATPAQTRLGRKQIGAEGVPAFVEVMLEAGSRPAAIELLVAHGWLLRVRPGFDVETLRQLLRVLEKPASGEPAC